jgi:chromosome partitioning protein
VDTDYQKSSSKWHGRRNETMNRLGDANTLKRIICVETSGKSTIPTIQDMERQHGLVIVDAGGADSPELRSAIITSNHVYIPFKPSVLDLETMEALELIKIHADGYGRDDIQYHAILSQAPSSPSKTELFEAKAFLGAYDFLQVSEEVVRDRVPYRMAIRDGRGVVDMGKSAGEAKAEIELLCYEIFKGVI